MRIDDTRWSSVERPYLALFFFCLFFLPFFEFDAATAEYNVLKARFPCEGDGDDEPEADSDDEEMD